MKVHNLLVTGSHTSSGEDIRLISSSVAATNLSQDNRISSLENAAISGTTITRLNSIEGKTGSFATTGSNIFIGTQTISGSIVPSVNGTYDLGSSTHEFRHLYLSSASLYIDGTKVLGSTTQELQITTDTGQSFKILEAGSDTITLQAADGNITLATSGGGDVILDPTTGVIALKGTTTIYAGNKVLSSDGNAIQFGNSVTMTGSLVVTGYIETQELRTTYISSSILYRSGSTKFGDELGDTHSFTGSLSVSGSVSVPGSGLVSGSSQITYSGLTGVPSGIISGSSQLPSGLVSGSAQITLSSTTGYGSVLNQAVLTTSSPTFAGLTNNSTYSQSTTSTQPVTIYGDSAASNGLFRIQIDEVSDSFGTGARTFLGDGGIDIFLGTSNSSYTPGNTYIALNHSGEISMGAGSANKHFTIASGGTANFSSSLGVGYSSPAYQLQVLNTIGLRANSQNFQAIKGTGWGYSPGSYRVVMLGDSDPANFTTVSIGYDPSGNSNGAFNGSGNEVLFRNGASFATPTSGNTSFHLNTLVMKDGKIGIGTDTPSHAIDVNGNIRINQSVAYLYFTSTTTNRYIAYNGADTYWRSDGVHYFEKTSGYKGSWDANSNLTVNGSITSGDLLYVGSGGGGGGVWTWSSGDSYLYGPSNKTFWIGVNGLTDRGLRIYTTGHALFSHNLTVNGTFTESSSIRYKENVEPIKYGLDKVLQMRGVTYTRKDNGNIEAGVIAEEMNEVTPLVVLKNEEGVVDSVSYGRINAYLIEAIKELKKEIEELKQNK